MGCPPNRVNSNLNLRLLHRNESISADQHGRETGCCPDVFSLCKPRVIVFSDSSIQYTTQEMANTYNNYATGVTFNGETRRVLSTRNDGSFSWTI